MYTELREDIAWALGDARSSNQPLIKPSNDLLACSQKNLKMGLKTGCLG